MNKAGILLILIALLCVGQGFGPKIVKGPMPTSPNVPTDLMSLQHLAYWWIGTNAQVAQTTTTVTNWPSIGGLASSWTNVNGSIAPTTNGGGGVLFTRASSQYLTNNNVAIAPGGLVGLLYCVIIRPVSTDTGDLLKYHPSASTPLYFIDASGNVSLYESPTIYSFRTKLSAARTTDVLWFYPGTNSPVLTCWTNGVQSYSGTVQNAANMSHYVLGGSASDGYLNVALYEFAIWTNWAPNASEIANIHKYATNAYGFTP